MSIKILNLFLCIPFGCVASMLSSISVCSQIIPDTTLGSEGTSVITPANINGLPSERIDGGTIRGANLFHSFQEFNVGEGRGTYFTNPAGIENILSRVTGNNPSKILGTLGVLGNANLFLINPNGITFGANARLSLGGSFLASTANSINLSDDTQFSATNPQPIPLLKISVPIGLQLGSNPGTISVKGTGHNLSLPFTGVNSAGAPVLGSGESLSGLRTTPGKTIALVGGSVDFDGGILTAPSGQIEVGSATSGSVSVNSTPNGIFLNYDGIQSFQDIKLDKRALLDASGFFNGNIFLRAKNLTITNGSFVLVSNFSDIPSGQINLKAVGSLQITGNSNPATPDPNLGVLAAGIGTQNFSTGKGADIFVSAPKIFIQEAFGIATETFASGKGGDIKITTVEGEPTPNFNNTSSEVYVASGLIASFASTTSSQPGQAGELILSTNRLFILNGSTVASETFGFANGGQVRIDAYEKIEISGGIQLPYYSFLPSFLGALTTSFGNAGDVSIKTRELKLDNGGRLSSSTLALGSAGNLDITATDSINVIGKGFSSSSPSQITSSANIIDPALILFYGLSNTLSGLPRSVTIKTNELNVRDGAQISAQNDGTRGAGILEIYANSINLDNQGIITAGTNAGNGGEIRLQAQNLQLLNNSRITATARGSGNGGNLTINTDTLAALENSDITADALGGTGGRVTINAQGIFGSPGSDITALGKNPEFNGIVQFNTPEVDPSRGLVTLATELVDVTGLIAQECPLTVGALASKFVVTGHGGLPDDPNKTLSGGNVVEDWGMSNLASAQSQRDRVGTHPENRSADPAVSMNPASSESAPLVEAQGWVINAKGEVVLTATAPTVTSYIPWLTAATCHGN